MTRVYKPRLSQPCENDFLISSFLWQVIFLPLSFVPQGLCVSGSMWISHLVTVPSTHSHCKILLASSKTDPPWVFHPLFFLPSLSLSRCIYNLPLEQFCFLSHATVWYFISALKPQGNAAFVKASFKSEIDQSILVRCHVHVPHPK